MRYHPLVDGNKRAGHLVAATLVEVHGWRLSATEDEQFVLR